MKNYLSALFMLIFLTFSCRQKATLTEEDRFEIKYKVRCMLLNYNMQIAQRGLLAEFDYLDSSADFFWVPPGYKQSISYDSVSKVLRASAPKFSKVANYWDTIYIEPLSRKLATYTGRMQSYVTDTSGKQSHTSIIETGVVVRRGNEWKLLCGQTSVLAK